MAKDKPLYSIEHECDSCAERFIVKFFNKQVISFCPFCGDDILVDEEDEDLEDEYEQEDVEEDE